jgi:hypothetical protein
MEYNNDFRYDLNIGRLAEKKIADILENKKLEVKYDKIASKTGNVVIEYESRNKPSGIAITQADYYCYIIANTQCDDIYILIAVDKLKALCRKYYTMNKIIHVGDNNTSKAVIIPLQELFTIKTQL